MNRLPLLALAFFIALTFATPAAHAQAIGQPCPNFTCDGDAVCKGNPPTCQANAATCNPACSGNTPVCDNSSGTPTCVAVDPSQIVQVGANTCNPACTGSQVCVNNGGTSTCQDPASSSATNPPTGAGTPTNLSSDKSPSGFFDTMMSWLMSLFAWLLGVAAITLDNAMYYTVVHMGAYVNGLSAVGVAWRILRDIGNIILIFGFVALGITVILDVNWYGGGTKMLPVLLIAAVFLNFSLFIAEAVVDVGNIFATEFYTQINGGSAAAPVDYFKSGAVSNEGISKAVMNQLGMQSIYGGAVGANGQNVNKIFSQGNTFVVGFMAILLFMIAAFVFFSLAFILIARFIFLIFLIIVAPIGFAGLAVPKLDGLANQWWGALFEQTLTAPAMLLMLYVALAVITDANFLTGFSSSSNGAASSWTDWLAGSQGVTGLANIMLSFLVAMGLLLAVTMLSKKMGAVGATAITKTVKGIGLGAGAFALGMATYPVRAGARKLTYVSGKWLEEKRSTPGGRIAAGIIKYGTLGVVTDIDLKKGTDALQKVKYGTRYSSKEIADFEKEDKPKRDAAVAVENAQRDLAARKITADQAEAIITKNLSGMSTKQLEELPGIKKGIDALVKNLSPQQFSALMKSDTLGDAAKGSIKTARYRELNGSIEFARANAGRPGATDQLGKVLGGLSKGELEAMPSETLLSAEVLENLSDKQRDTLVDSAERTTSEKDRVRAESKGGRLESKFNNPALGPAQAARDLRGLSPSQVAKLPKKILTNDDIASALTPSQLSAIQKEDKLDPGEIIRMKAAINAHGNVAAQNHILNPLNAWYWS